MRKTGSREFLDVRYLRVFSSSCESLLGMAASTLDSSFRSLASPRRPRRVVVVGVGAMGRLHARVVRGLPYDFELAGVFDASHAVAEEIARAWSVTCFDDERACIASADLVVIASPIEAHAGTARRALEEGRHVLVEKPLCAHAADAQALVRAATRGSARLFVGHSERFNPVIRALRHLVGPADVRALAIRRVTSPPGRRHEHGVLLSLGVHDVDLAAYLTGGPVELRNVSSVVRTGDEDQAELNIVAATGAAVRLRVDRLAPRRERTIHLLTSTEEFVGNLLEPRLFRRPRGGGEPTEVALPTGEPLAAQAKAVSRALDGEPSAGAATGTDGAHALTIVLSASQAMREGTVRPLTVSEAS
jgi:predicted dehydrogenase